MSVAADHAVVEEPQPSEQAEATEDEVLAGLLVEEISIDGMCGVY